MKVTLYIKATVYMEMIVYIEVIVFEIMLKHSLICSSVITRGGANLMMSPWVGLASKPLLLNCMQTSKASYSEINVRNIFYQSSIASYKQVNINARNFQIPPKDSQTCFMD